MVRELGRASAEARLKEAAHAIAPKADAANKIDLKIFIGKG